MATYKASKKQIFYIEKLVEEIRKEGGEVPEYAEEFLNRNDQIMSEATVIIDWLKEELGWDTEDTKRSRCLF